MRRSAYTFKRLYVNGLVQADRAKYIEITVVMPTTGGVMRNPRSILTVLSERLFHFVIQRPRNALNQSLLTCEPEPTRAKRSKPL